MKVNAGAVINSTDGIDILLKPVDEGASSGKREIHIAARILLQRP